MHRCMSLRDGPIYDSGVTTGYKVGSLPPGHEAFIANFGAPNRDDWRLLQAKEGVQGNWTDSYKSAEEALAVLQEEYYGVNV
jgi:hypothetical protein